MVWEAHNCTIRGEIIKMGSLYKREREKDITTLTDKIRHLENLHKQSLSTHSATEHLKHRKALQQPFDEKSRRLLFFKKQIYYKSGNKPGKLLARALKTAKKSNFRH